ncbi:MAG: hypothetical protein ACU85U_16630 [Gammaproteobacteria bacterium]|jgi:hypothetical protein
MDDSAFDFELKREYGLSQKDFFRIFPRIEPSWQQLDNHRVEVNRDDGRSLQIEISPEQVRKLATLRIPYIDITFRFARWTQEQRAEFFDYFDRAFQKGGG